MAKHRKFLPTLGELIDRLSIHQLKEVFIPENKKNYSKEMSDMVHDIDMLLKEHKGKITGDVIRAIVVLSQMNAHNEPNVQHIICSCCSDIPNYISYIILHPVCPFIF